MPITNQKSYISTMQMFASHWLDVNTAIAPDAIKMENAYTLANFNGDIVILQTAFTNVETQMAVLERARADVRSQRKAMIRRVEQLRKAVLATMPNSLYATMLPKTPALDSIDTRFLQPVDRSASLWLQINTTPPSGFTPPLKLDSTYTLANFTTDVAALRTAIATYNAQRYTLMNATKARNVLFPAARQRMKQYRAAVQGRFAPSSTLYKSLPRLSPVAGATPKAVTNVLVAYNVPDNSVRVTFTPSTSANILKYELLLCPGTKWNATDSVVVETRENAPPFAFDFRLTQIEPGEKALLRVVTFNQTENQRASKTVKIERALALELTLESREPSVQAKAA